MTKKKPYPRFVFTQLSGIAAGMLGAFFSLKYFIPIMQSVFEGSSNAKHLLVIFALAVIIVSSAIIAMKVWGWILVKIGILSKKEAIGYPYSKPWEIEENTLL